MSVIFQNECGFLICTKSYFDEIYSFSSKVNATELNIVLKESFFDIRTPFMTDSKARKLSQVFPPEKNNEIKKAKKKKKILPKNMLECSEIIVFIKKNIDDLINAGKIAGILENSEVTSVDWFENNSKAREAAKEIMHYVNPTLKMGLHFVNPLSHSIVHKFGHEEYVIPARSEFHLCDVTSFIEATDQKFDVIIIDPPWVNRSVKRKSSFHSLKYEHLQSLPFERLVNPGCLIVVWVTNSSSAASYVLEDLFPKCNVILTSMWHWCKITKNGTFVYPVDSHHKKPYENLILGRVQYEDNTNTRPFKEIDSKKLIVSIPSSIHSHKPPIIDILKPYIKEEACCLELFGRYLLPGFTSVGNEVLKLQSIKLFDISCSNNVSV